MIRASGAVSTLQRGGVPHTPSPADARSVPPEPIPREDRKDDRQFDRVFGHATKVSEWLSSLDMSKPGLIIVIREPDDTEIDPTGHS
jgi:hypothetical protein